MNIIKKLFLRIKYRKVYKAFMPYLPQNEIYHIMVAEYENRDLSALEFNRQHRILSMLHDDLASGKNISKENILTIINNFTVVNNFNTDTKMYSRAILPILYYRPELGESLFEHIVRPLLYSCCDNYNDIKVWFLSHMSPDDGLDTDIMEWFEKEIDNFEDTINQIIDKIRKEKGGDYY